LAEQLTNGHKCEEEFHHCCPVQDSIIGIMYTHSVWIMHKL